MPDGPLLALETHHLPAGAAADFETQFDESGGGLVGDAHLLNMARQGQQPFRIGQDAFANVRWQICQDFKKSTEVEKISSSNLMLFNVRRPPQSLALGKVALSIIRTLNPFDASI